MGLFDGLSQRDSAPQAMGPSPQYNGNLGAPQNYWQGNQMQIPGLAAYLAQQQGGAAQPAPQGLTAQMQAPAQAPQGHKPNGIEGFLQSGGLGLLPMLLAGGSGGDFKGVGLSNLLGGIGGLLGNK